MFGLSVGFYNSLCKRQAPFGNNGLGEMVFYRTYSRTKDDGKKETWQQVVKRVIEGTMNMAKKQRLSLGLSWDQKEMTKTAEEMALGMFEMKWLPPGRGLWAMGTAITQQKHLFAALNNCGFVSTVDIDKDPSKPFVFLMDASMLGVGVGFDSRGAGKITIVGPYLLETLTEVSELSSPVLTETRSGSPIEGDIVVVEDTKVSTKKYKTEPVIIEDTREGWVLSLKALLDAFFLGKPMPVFDYSKLRVKGVPLKVFGGVSSGPEPLMELHKSVESVLLANIGKPISTRVINDIMNMIGCCVVSGNVRRSSEISLGEPGDEEFLNLKNYTRHPERAAYGWASNNSIMAKLGTEFGKTGGTAGVVDRIANNGEPGVIFLDNIRKYGRMSDPPNDKDHRVMGVNPCVTGDMKVLAWDDNGVEEKYVKDLVGKQFGVVINGKCRWKSTEQGFWSNGVKPVYRITLSDGNEIKATDDHRFMNGAFRWQEVKSMKVGDKLILDKPQGRKYKVAISRIESAGEEEVYDCTVPGPHFYVLSGVYSHNCVTEDTMIFTTEGMKPVSELIAKSFHAIVGDKSYASTSKGFWLTGERMVYKITLDTGMTIKATDNHKFLTTDGKWLSISEMSGNPIFALNDHGDINWGGQGTYEEGYFLGNVIGDGTFAKSRQGEDVPIASFWIYKNQFASPGDHKGVKIIVDLAKKLVMSKQFKGYTVMGKHDDYWITRIKTVGLAKVAKRFGVKPIEKKVPENGSRDFCRGLLQGIFDADGTVGNYHKCYYTVRLAQVDIEKLRAVQRILMCFGIKSKIYENRRDECVRPMPDGKGGSKEYKCRAVHELIISKGGLTKFRKWIGFLESAKQKKLDEIVSGFQNEPQKSKFESTIKSIEEIGTQKVYDCTIPGISCFSTQGGIFAHNCSEQSLESYELCCLAELFPFRCNTEEEFLTAAKHAFMYAKIVTLGNTHWDQTNEVIVRNRRIGCGITGVAQFIEARGLSTLKTWCENAYKHLKVVDKEFSGWLAIPESIKITTVKPSGSISLVAGATPGMHYPEARFYIRRVIVGNDDPILKIMQDAGYPTEPSKYTKSSSVVEFPIDAGEGIRSVKDVSMWEQLELASFLQSVWSDNQVSATVTFKPSEKKDIARALDIFQYRLKSVSFLPREEEVDGKKPYEQMPYEEITSGEYTRRVAMLKPINFAALTGSDGVGENFCGSDTCMLALSKG